MTPSAADHTMLVGHAAAAGRLSGQRSARSTIRASGSRGCSSGREGERSFGALSSRLGAMVAGAMVAGARPNLARGALRLGRWKSKASSSEPERGRRVGRCRQAGDTRVGATRDNARLETAWPDHHLHVRGHERRAGFSAGPTQHPLATRALDQLEPPSMHAVADVATRQLSRSCNCRRAAATRSDSSRHPRRCAQAQPTEAVAAPAGARPFQATPRDAAASTLLCTAAPRPHEALAAGALGQGRVQRCVGRGDRGVADHSMPRAAAHWEGAGGALAGVPQPDAAGGAGAAGRGQEHRQPGPAPAARPRPTVRPRPPVQRAARHLHGWAARAGEAGGDPLRRARRAAHLAMDLERGDQGAARAAQGA
eukprot:scaffold11683_cov63-Phaeocystis_antarctica.AAC.3